MSARETRRGGASLWLAVLVLATACGSPSDPAAGKRPGPVPAAGKRPDIVLVSIDSLRPDHLGCYGYMHPTSPAIDRIAEQGVVFRNAVSTTSWTLPAHASMFTGLYCSTHGLVDNGLRLADDAVTLAEVLAAAGYRTAGFYGGPYLHPTYGVAQGFETYESCMTEITDDVSQDAMRSVARGDTNVSHRDVTGPLTVRQVTQWLDGVDDRPFFLFVHLWDVHYDYIPPAEYARIFDPDYSGPVSGHDVMHDPAVREDMPKRDLEHLLALYDGEIRFTDDNLGKILDALGRRGRLDSSIVVVTADHGEEFFEHGQKGHQRSLYDEVLRVPLVVRWPGQIAPGRVVNDQVQLVDIMPTLASLAGVPLTTEVEGRDLSPLLRGEPLAEVPALCELQVKGKPNLYAARTNRWKIITFPSPHFWEIGAQYFDLERDPGERTALSPWSLDFWRADRSLTALRRDAAVVRGRLGGTSVAAPEADPVAVVRLKALGYLGGGK